MLPLYSKNVEGKVCRLMARTGQRGKYSRRVRAIRKVVMPQLQDMNTIRGYP